MTVDPDPIAERSESIHRRELSLSERQSLEGVADIDPELLKEFDL